LKKYDKAIKREDKIDNGGEEDDMSVSSKSHGSVQSAGAMGAIEEASRKMRLIALKAY
jgi:hypothetical protein